MKQGLAIIYIYICGLLSGCQSALENIYLSDVTQGFIANEFGPPEIDRSFEHKPLTIRGEVFAKGLGTHAPAAFNLDLHKKGIEFRATVGIDDVALLAQADTARRQMLKTANYIYDGNADLFDYSQGGTVNFQVWGDNRLLHQSGWLSVKSPPHQLKVDVRGITTLSLIVDKGSDGSYADHADWAEAQITFNDTSGLSALKLYSSRPDLLLNHRGFLPSSPKTFRTAQYQESRQFEVIHMDTDSVVFRGEMVEKSGDWGNVFIGDFSTLRQPGAYYLKYGSRQSQPFVIDQHLYLSNLTKHLNWFLWQRCGDPDNGWERGQHRDDGVRLDNSRHQDVSGGWHDAADLRKWGMTINGLWTLSEIYLTLSAKQTPKSGGNQALMSRIKAEFDWGNKYFTSMQEPAGYLMDQIGGDVYKHGDNNRFTDNVSGTADDRWIVTTPNTPVFQFMFIIAQCNLAIAGGEPSLGPNMHRALRCFDWAIKNNQVQDIHSLGAAAVAAMKLYTVSGEQQFRNQAINWTSQLLACQVTSGSLPSGFMRAWKPQQAQVEGPPLPDGNIAYNLITPYFPLWAVVEAMHLMPDQTLQRQAKEVFIHYVEHYLTFFDTHSTYGNLPIALFPSDPGGGRQVGYAYYRWGYVNNEDKEWWNGLNPHLGYLGAYLVRGGRLAGHHKAVRLGQQQLDFIYGCNPFNASTVTGLGYNQPDYFKTSTFVPYTPLIMGAVMAGIGTSQEDQPVLLPGWWQTTEYWLEAVCGTLMVLNELQDLEK